MLLGTKYACPSLGLSLHLGMQHLVETGLTRVGVGHVTYKDQLSTAYAMHIAVYIGRAINRRIIDARPAAARREQRRAVACNEYWR